MRFARAVFVGAGVWGMVVLAPLYFLVDVSGRRYAPPASDPQFFYGFVSVAMAWQIAFLMIGSNPVRFRPLMIVAILEKVGYVVGAVVLHAHARISSADTAAAVPDAILAALFAIAFLRTPLPDTAVISRPSRVAGSVLLLLLCVTPRLAHAQSTLSLADAIARARAHNPEAGSAAAAEGQAAQRVSEVRGGYLPKVDVMETWQRGNAPGFVFSSLLAERRFAAPDFALDVLNHPTAADNFRTAISVAQPLFDRTIAANVRDAAVARQMAGTSRQLVDQVLAADVTAAFGDAVIAAARVRSASAVVETARADRELAGNRRDAGRVTDADVLQLDVYLARASAAQVEAVADERVARARLNRLMGDPLDSAFSLDPEPAATRIDISDPAALEAIALKDRPEVLLARQQEQRAAISVTEAQAAFLPTISAQGGWEFDGAKWNARTSSWMVGAVARVNVFNGFSDKARLAAARYELTRRAFEKDTAESQARLAVLVAIARLEAARAEEVVGRTAADQAQASHRIVRDRYASGLADIATLLRSADAIDQAVQQQTAARVNVLVAAANLQRAIGKL